MKWFTIMAAVLILAIPVVILGQVPVTADKQDTKATVETHSGAKEHKAPDSNTGLPVGLGYVAAAAHGMTTGNLSRIVGGGNHNHRNG